MILIFSRFSDIHASAVSWGLEKLGVDSAIIDLYDVVAGGMVLLDEQEDVLSWRSTQSARSYSLKMSDIECVWLRRMDADDFNLSSLHEDDKEVAKDGLKRLATSLYGALGERVRASINGVESRFLAELKPSQLRAARAAGFTIPRTLIGNDPGRVEAFLRDNDRSIFKPFEQNMWLDDGVQKVQRVSLVDLGLMEHAGAIERSPGIFQSYVEKAFELRLTVMGDDIYAAKLESQKVKDAEVDWKGDMLDRIPITPFDLPESEKNKVFRFMRKMNFRFGCIDVIVTPQGEYVFLEVNPQGQFLWVEQRAPSIPLLEKFCKFLCGEAGVAFEDKRLSFQDYVASPAFRAFDELVLDRYPDIYGVPGARSDARAADDLIEKII
jgi:hypothetical protein